MFVKQAYSLLSFGQARPVRMHEAIHMYASPHAYVRVNRICIFFFPKAFHPFFTFMPEGFFSNYPYRFDEFCSEFPELCLEVLSDSPLLLAEGLSQKQDKAKVFLYEISDEPGFWSRTRILGHPCSYNYRVSEGRVGYKIKEEMI